MRSASTAMQYWIEEESTKANYMKKSQKWFNQLKRKENALGLSLRSFVGPKIGLTDSCYEIQ